MCTPHDEIVMLNSSQSAPPRGLFQSRPPMRAPVDQRRLLPLIAILMALVCLSPVAAQESFGNSDLFPDFSLGDFGGESQPADWTAIYSVTEPGVGLLTVEVALGRSWHIYSVTQKPGGPLKTKLSIAAPADVKVTAAFQPNSPPKKSVSSVYDGLTVEEHDGVVNWSAPISFPVGFQGPITVAVEGLICKTDGHCVPVQEQLIAKSSGGASAAQKQTGQNKTDAHAAAKIKPFRDGKYVVEWIGTVTPGHVKPGSRAVLKFTAKPDPTYHVYRAATNDAESSTNFVVTQKSDLKIGAPTTKNPVISKALAPGLDPIHYHKGEVTWLLPVEVPAGTAAGEQKIEGMIAYQACTDNSCHRPTALKFTAVLNVGDASAAEVVTVKMESAKYAQALDAAAETKWIDKIDSAEQEEPVEPAGGDAASAAPSSPPTLQRVAADSPEEIAEMAKLYNADEKVKYLTLDDMAANPVGSGGVSSASQTTFWTAMFGAFVGGMLLNLMPCVFPVLGLKVMGFVKQAGSDPAKIRLHGLVFAAGLIVSMWILAGVILLLKLSFGQDINWGAQMGNPYFVCAMIVLLFVLGLNMAGVFEFGSSMTRMGDNLQGKKGYSSSFLSGVLTTLIATPCSGPFLGAAMSYTLAQTATTAMFLFTIFALGIASPYVMLCFFPALINRLPRPGVWMETFKVSMAFALFATVAFFMQAFGNQTGASGLSWLAMALVVIGLAAYYYGTWTMPHIRRPKRLLCGYALPAAIAAIGLWMCYGAASQRAETSSYHAGGLAWQNWNPGKVEYVLAKQRRPVWVDYTAHW